MATGWSPEKEANKDIKEICDKMKPQAEASVGQIFSEFTATQYIFKFDTSKQKMKYSIRLKEKEYYIHLEVTHSPVEGLEFIDCLLPRLKENPLPEY